MLSYYFLSTLLVLALPRHVLCQFPPVPTNVTTIHSQLEKGVYLSLKENTICDNTSGVKSYAGYVYLPERNSAHPILSQSYNSHTFWWFFESRKDPANAPLVIWLNGGPASSSMNGLFAASGPCTIEPNGDLGGPNPFSWNREVNMLYIDQPVQAGFSYNTLINGTLDYADRDAKITLIAENVQAASALPGGKLQGTFVQEDAEKSDSTTRGAAISFWHFMQAWISLFPAHNLQHSKISLWTQSYGGKYGPAYLTFFEEQNKKIAEGTWNKPGLDYPLRIDALGLVNACIDAYVQETSLVQMLTNNTYGIEAVNESIARSAMERYKTGLKQVEHCRDLAAVGDSENDGRNETVNEACHCAFNTLLDAGNIMYNNTQGDERDYYDITAPYTNPFPSQWFVTYLNRAEVQQALGVPVNFTFYGGNAVYDSFKSAGDYVRGGLLEDLARLLDSGVKVALMYGDSDAVCNWFGGEAASLAIPHSGQKAFARAGYQAIQTNSSYVGGRVRQHGNLSFSRVFNAGHQATDYQPQTAYEIFMRTMLGNDVATGETCLTDTPSYSTQGPSDVFYLKNEVSNARPKPQCYAYNMFSTCTEDQIASVRNGTAIFEDYILIDEDTQCHQRPST